MHYSASLPRERCLSQSLPYGKWWKYEHQGRMRPLLNSTESSTTPSRLVSTPLCAGGTVYRQLLSAIRGRTTLGALCPLPSLGYEKRTTGRAGQGRVVPFAGTQVRSLGPYDLMGKKKVVLRQVRNRIIEDQSVQGLEMFFFFRG